MDLKYTNFQPREGRRIDPRRKVKVYRNLNRKGVWYSVIQDGKVVGYVEKICLHGVKFIVQPAGRDKTRRTGKKTVHAFVEGHVTDAPKNPPMVKYARYNPRFNDTFIDAPTQEHLSYCRYAFISEIGVQYI